MQTACKHRAKYGCDLKPEWHFLLNSLQSRRIRKTYLSEMSVANAASLALMLQERAEPSRLFLRACIAMILQILRTGQGRGFQKVNPRSDRKEETQGVRVCVTLLWHLPVLADPENLQCFALRFQRNALDLQLQIDAAKLWTVVKVVDGQLPQTAKQD